MWVDTSCDAVTVLRRVQAGKLLLKQELFSDDVQVSRWQRCALDGFAACLGSDDFPCLFGRKAWANDSVRFVFAECNGEGEFDDVLVGLTDYTNFVKATPLNDRLFSPLVMFFEASRLDCLSLHELGWQVLNWVHGMDPAPWPDEVARDPRTNTVGASATTACSCS